MFMVASRPANKPAMIGMNLADCPYYSTEHCFQNYARHFIEWRPELNGVLDSGGPITVDANGYPTNATSTLKAVGTFDLTASIPTGTTVELTWSGPATAVTILGGTNGSNTASYTKPTSDTAKVVVKVTASGVSNMVLKRSGETITGMFRQPFLDRCKRYSVLRFMNWAATNTATTRTWAGRTTENYLIQGSLSQGVAFEHMIDLCNQTGCGGWFCVHHTADNAYVTNLANLILSRRTGRWPVYIEHSNEVWNNIFPAQAYLDSIYGAGQWFTAHVARTQQIGTLMRATGLEITNVLGMHSTNVNFGQWYLVQSPSPYNLDGIDAIAIAPYFGNEAHMEPTLSTLTSVTATLDACEDHIDNGIFDQMQGWKFIADARKKRLIGYEGGQHLLMFNNATILDYMRDANRNTRMYDLTLKFLRQWNTVTGGDLMCYFNSVYYDTLWNGTTNITNTSGFWGAMTHEGQTVNSTTGNAVKQAAIVDFMAETKQ